MVNPKVASVFIPKVEDLVYNYLGIARKKTVTAENSNGKVDDLLPTDLEAVSPGSVKSNDDKNDDMDIDNTPEETKMEEDETTKLENNGDASKDNKEGITEVIEVLNNNSNSNDKSNIPLPTEEIKPENIPSPDNSPPKVELATIELPKEPIISTNIPLPEDINKEEKEKFFKPINSDDDDSSSDSSLRRNMSPLTPIRNFNNENSCDAQQGFENDIELKEDEEKEPSSFKFAIDVKSPEKSTEAEKVTKEKKETEDKLSYQFNNQVNINKFNTPLYEDSSNSNNLHIDYESDANSKANLEVTETENNSEDSKKERKQDEKKSSHKSSHRSRDSNKHTSSKDKRSDSKQSSSRDTKYDKSKSSKDDSKSKSSDKERSRDRSDRDKKDSKDSSRDSSRHRSSHKSSHRDSKSHKSSSSSHKHSSSKHSEDKKSSSSSSKDKSDKSMDRPKDSKSSSHRSDKDRKGSSSSSSKSDKNSKNRHDDKNKNKKSKKETDDHYSLSGRNNPNRRSTDRDSNDGSSSSKGSNQQSGSKSSENKKESKSSSKSESTSTSGDSTSPSDKENIIHEQDTNTEIQNNAIRIESHLEQPLVSPPRLPFVPDITIKKPKFAANLKEAKRLMKMRKFLDEEQKRMNQEAVLLLEFQANVRPSLSQVYSSIPGPELEFACVTNSVQNEDIEDTTKAEYPQEPHYTNKQLLNVLNDATIEVERKHRQMEEKSEEICKENNDKNDNVQKTTFDHEPIENDVDIHEEAIDNSDSDERVEIKTEFEITIVAEDLSDNEEFKDNDKAIPNESKELNKEKKCISGETKLHYFGEHEMYDAEIERVKFANFLKEYTKTSNKLHLINCDSYEENIIRDESKKFGDYEIVTYHKNGYIKLPNNKNVIRNVNLSNEISLPIDNEYDESLKSSFFSPDKSECSFEFSDYDAKLEEMVNKTSRQEIMEIILGNVNASPSKMPTIDYFTESKIDNDIDYNLKRKMTDETINNNRHVLTPNKIRKLSTDQITSTTLGNIFFVISLNL